MNTQNARTLNNREAEVVRPVELADEAGVPPQMIYSYIRNERIPAFEGHLVVTETDDEGNEQTVTKERVQKLIKAEDAQEWLTDYLDRKAEREARQAEEQEAETVDA